MIKMTVLFPISHDCQISFEYIIIISLYVLAELGDVLSAILKKTKNGLLKMLLWKRAKAELI